MSDVDGGSTPDAGSEASGCAWVTAWLGAGSFILGAALVGLMFVGANAGPFGIGAVVAGLFMATGVVALGLVTAVAIIGRARSQTARESSRSRILLASLLLSGAGTLFVLFVADVFEPRLVELDSLWLAAGCITLTALAALVALGPGERPAVVLLAIAWIVLLLVLALRLVTEVDVNIHWLGAGTTGQGPTYIAFGATRSGDFDVWREASGCGDGQLVASGRYSFDGPAPGSTHGELLWVALPAEALPLRIGDVFRVCLRDGLAGASAGAEVVGNSFRPID